MFCQKEITLEEQCTVKFVPFFWGISRRPIAIASGIWYNKRVEKRCVQSIAKLLFFYYNKREKVRRNSDWINTSAA